MMELLILLFMIASGAVVSLHLGYLVVGDAFVLTKGFRGLGVPLLVSGAFVGALAGVVVLRWLHALQRRNRAVPTRKRKATQVPPRDFRDRMSSYSQGAGHIERFPDGSFQSTVSFWTRVFNWVPAPVRTSSELRRILERIRAVVRGKPSE